MNTIVEVIEIRIIHNTQIIPLKEESHNEATTTVLLHPGRCRGPGG